MHRFRLRYVLTMGASPMHTTRTTILVLLLLLLVASAANAQDVGVTFQDVPISAMSGEVSVNAAAAALILISGPVPLVAPWNVANTHLESGMSQIQLIF